MTPHDEDALDNQCICTRTVNPKRTIEFLKSWNTDAKGFKQRVQIIK
jgi:hypothetical protein